MPFCPLIFLFSKQKVKPFTARKSKCKQGEKSRSILNLIPFTFMLKVEIELVPLFIVDVDPDLFCRTLGTMFKTSVGEGFSECLCLIV